MTDILFPPSLPQAPLNSNYAHDVGSTMLVSHMELGPAKRRLRQSRAIDRKSVSYILTDEEKETLSTFVNDTLSQGMRPFLFPKNCSGEYEEVRLLPISEGVLLQWTRNSNYWAVTLQLEVLP